MDTFVERVLFSFVFVLVQPLLKRFFRHSIGVAALLSFSVGAMSQALVEEEERDASRLPYEKSI